MLIPLPMTSLLVHNISQFLEIFCITRIIELLIIRSTLSFYTLQDNRVCVLKDKSTHFKDVLTGKEEGERGRRKAGRERERGRERKVLCGKGEGEGTWRERERVGKVEGERVGKGGGGGGDKGVVPIHFSCPNSVRCD